MCGGLGDSAIHIQFWREIFFRISQESRPSGRAAVIIFQQEQAFILLQQEGTMSSGNNYSSWVAVRDTITDRSDGIVTAKASVRWWTVCGENHIKGDITLERFGDTPLFRIVFSGRRVSDSHAIKGVIPLPVDASKQIVRSLLESKHSCAHGIKVTLSDNPDAIESIQLIVPAVDAATNITGIVFGEALEYAENERRRMVGGSSAQKPAKETNKWEEELQL